MRGAGGAARPRTAVAPAPAVAQRWLARMLAAAEAGDAAAPRARGAVATPAWIAERMARQLVSELPRGTTARVLDAGCGAGRLLVETARAAGARGLHLHCTGIESDAGIARAADALAPLVRAAFGATVASWRVQHADFLQAPLATPFDLAIANPPYVPLRALDAATRHRLRTTARSGDDLAALFVARMLQHLRPGGRLVVIVPAMLLAAGHARPLRRALHADFTLEQVHDLSIGHAFAGVGTYPVILVVRRTQPTAQHEVRVRDACDRPRARWRRADLARMPAHLLPLGLDAAGLALAARLLAGPRLGDAIHIACGLASSGFGRAVGAGPERILQSGDVTALRLRAPSRFDPGRAGITPAALERLRVPKVVIPGMFRRLCAAFDARSLLLGRVYFARPVDAAERALLLALLNSRLAAVMYRGLFAAVAQSGGYTRCNAPYVMQLPWPDRIGHEEELKALLAMLQRRPIPSGWLRLDALVEDRFGLDPGEVACVERLARELPPRPGEGRSGARPARPRATSRSSSLVASTLEIDASAP